MGSTTTPAQRLHAALLPFTFKNALQIPFYRQHWRAVDTTAADADAVLGELPFVSRDLYRAELMDAVDDGAAYVSHTTGTTSDMAFRYRSVAEAAVIAQLFRPRNQDIRLGINVSAGPHGMAMPVPSSTVFLTAAVNWQSQIVALLALLGQQFRLYGSMRAVEVLAGNAQDLVLVAQAALARPEQRPPPELRSVLVTGFIDPVQRDLLERAFGAIVVNRWSMTEVFGGATAVGEGPLTLDAHVVGEVINASGHRARSDEVGELVLTELFPFIQLQPLVRYRSRDIVRVVETDPLRFHWLGRSHECVVLDDRRVIAFRDLADALAADLLVARVHPRTPLQGLAHAELGVPDISIDGDSGGTVTIRIGITRNPHLYESAVDALLRCVWKTVGSHAPSASAHLRVRLRVGTDDLVEASGPTTGPPPMIGDPRPGVR